MRRFRLHRTLRSRRRRGGAAGFTLVECIMALAVLGVGLAALFQTLFIAAQSNRFAREVSSGAYLANAFLEQVRRRAVIWDPDRAKVPPLFAADPRAHWRQVFPDLPLKNDATAAPPWCDPTLEFCPITRFLDNVDFTSQAGWVNPETGHWEVDDTGSLHPYTDPNTQYIMEYRAEDIGMLLNPNNSADVVRLTVRVSWSNKSQGITAGRDYSGTISEWHRRMVLFDTVLTGGYLTEPQGT